jgi:hypothetical protein
MRVEVDVAAAGISGLSLGGLDKPAAEAGATEGFLKPEDLDMEPAAPDISSETTSNQACLIADE